MRILILHDKDGYAGVDWGEWLHDELQKQGYIVTTPILTDSNYPNRNWWSKEIQQITLNFDTKDLIVVGHSLGVISALDFIEQSIVPVKALISVSGFSADYGAEQYSAFLRQKNLDFARIRANLGQSVVIYGDDDPYVPVEALRQLAQDLAVKPIVIADGGHLNTERGYTTFPLLLDIILKISA